MGVIEDELRSTFAVAVSRTPAVDDAAGRAIRGAGLLRRRRTTVTVLAAAACVAMVGAGIMVLGPGPARSDLLPTVPSPVTGTDVLEPPLPLPVLDRAGIVLPDRTEITFGDLKPNRAWRAADGWLLTSRTSTRTSLWFLPLEGGLAMKIVEGDAVVISPSGNLVAWSTAGRVAVAPRNAAILGAPRELAGTTSHLPAYFVDDAIVLTGPDDGGQTTSQIWYPQQSDLPEPTQYDQTLFGPNVAGTRLYGFSGTPGQCLSTLVPLAFGVEKSACGLDLRQLAGVDVSPNGAWMTLRYPDRIDLYPATGIWTSPPPTLTWYVAKTAGLTWLDNRSFVVSTGSDIIRYRVDTAWNGESFYMGPRPTDLGEGEDGYVWPVATLG